MADQNTRDWQAINLVQAIGGQRKTNDDLSPNRPDGPPVDFAANSRHGREFDQHRLIAVEFSAALTDILSCQVNGQIIAINHSSSAQWRSAFEFPACIARLQTKRGDEKRDIGFIHIELRLAYALIDRMLGGTPLSSVSADRVLTEIESKILLRLTESYTHAFRLALPACGPISFDVMESEFIQQIQEPHETQLNLASSGIVDWVCVTTNLEFMGLRGNWSVVLPSPALRSHDIEPGQHDSESGQHEIVVAIDEIPLTCEEVSQLQVGDVILLGPPGDVSAKVRLAGVSFVSAAIGTTEGKKSIRIRKNQT